MPRKPAIPPEDSGGQTDVGALPEDLGMSEPADTATAKAVAANFTPSVEANGAEAHHEVRNTTPRPRGRPKGSTNKKSGKAPYQTRAELAEQVERLESELAARSPDGEAAIQATVEPLRVTFHFIGSILARAQKTDRWLFSESETRMLAEAWAPCVGPYLADSPDALKWATAIAVSWVVVSPRVLPDKQLELGLPESTEPPPHPTVSAEVIRPMGVEVDGYA